MFATHRNGKWLRPIPVPAIAVVIAIVLGLPSPPTSAFAETVEASGDAGMPSTVTSHPSIDPATWAIGSHAGRMEVLPDPTHGPWVKQLQLDPPSLAPGPRELVEFLVVGGSVPWTGWHETILPTTAGWNWSAADLVVQAERPGDEFPNTPDGLVVTITPTEFDLVFDPLPPGTLINIRKTVVSAGISTGLEVAEYPVASGAVGVEPDVDPSSWSRTKSAFR